MDLGLFDGISSDILYYYETENELDNLEKVVEAVSVYFSNTNDLSLCSGISGIFWLFDFLMKKDFIQNWDEDFKKEKEFQIFESYKNDLILENFDFLYGATGKLKVLYEVNSCFLLDATHMFYNAIKSKYKIYKLWEIAGDIDLGMAHGLLSILNLLSNLIQIMYDNEIIDFLNYSYLFLLNMEILSFENKTYFPTKIKNNILEYTSPNGWCYGDLITILTFTKIYNVLKDDKMLIEIKRITLKVIDQMKNEKIFEDDSPFICHGLAGKQLILKSINRLLELDVIHQYINVLSLELNKYNLFNSYGLITGFTGVKLANNEKSLWTSILFLN